MKVKVLYCIETIKSGGVEQRRLSLAKYMDSGKFELKIICTQAIGPLADDIKVQGVEVIPIGKIKHSFHWTKIREVIKVIKKFKPHIIHGAVFEGVSMALIAGWIGRVPIVIGEETSDPQNRSKKATIFLRGLSFLADIMVAISPSVEDYLYRKALIPKSKIRVINNGVGLPNLYEELEVNKLRERLGIRNDDVIIGSVGRILNDHKRFSDLIEAFSLVYNRNVKLLILGDGPDLQYLKSYANILKIHERVFFLGYQFDTDIYYQIMDIFCISSSREGFGLVAAEAMMHKLPVIATAVGGLKDIIVDNKTGYLVPPLNPRGMADKLEILINDADKREFMGEVGYERAIKYYSAKRYVKEVEEMYQELLIKKRLTINNHS